MLVWVNVHGGFLVGFALVGIYWFSAVWQWSRLKDVRFDDALRKIRAGNRVRALTLAGILSAAATLVNPYGLQLHLHIYRYLSNRFLMDHIDEFQSPNFHYVAQKCFAGLLLLTLVAVAVKKREIGVSQGLVVLFAVYSGLYASRNIPVSSLLLILIIGPWLSDAMERLAGRRIALGWQASPSAGFLQRMKAIELNLRGHLWPIAAVNYLEKQNIAGPLVSTDYWGGFLIYRLYPRVRTVVDDRHDFYGEEFLKSYLKMLRVEPGWADFLQQHPARCVLVPKDSALASILLESPDWKPIYTDDVAVAFVRTAAP